MLQSSNKFSNQGCSDFLPAFPKKNCQKVELNLCKLLKALAYGDFVPGSSGLNYLIMQQIVGLARAWLLRGIPSRWHCQALQALRMSCIQCLSEISLKVQKPILNWVNRWIFCEKRNLPKYMSQIKSILC